MAPAFGHAVVGHVEMVVNGVVCTLLVDGDSESVSYPRKFPLVGGAGAWGEYNTSGNP